MSSVVMSDVSQNDFIVARVMPPVAINPRAIPVAAEVAGSNDENAGPTTGQISPRP